MSNKPKTSEEHGQVISVTEMAERVSLSRARFYELVGAGFFTSPAYATDSKQPLYLPEDVSRNLLARKTGIGIDGSMRTFNRRRSSSADESHGRHSRQSKGRRRSGQDEHDKLMSGFVADLKGLGLKGVTEQQVGDVMAELFPQGTSGIKHDDVLRALYRRLNGS